MFCSVGKKRVFLSQNAVKDQKYDYNLDPCIVSVYSLVGREDISVKKTLEIL